MRRVGDVGEVEEVVVGADLEVGAAGADHVEHGREDLDIAGAEEAGGADGAGEEGGGGLAVGGEDVGFCLGLWFEWSVSWA